MRTRRKSCLILFVIALFVSSCRMIISDKETCPIEDLLLSTSDLPGSQWEEVGSRSYRDAPSKLGVERIGTGFSTPYSGIAGENVYRFCNEEDAKNGFVDLSDLWSRLEPEGTTWTKLELPHNFSINTTDYRLECSVRRNQSNRSCWYISRYEKTVIEFRADMLLIKDEDLFRIIKLLDQKATTCG